ncbi:hypothetical protein [Persicobacter sp. CCB-QB2]|uniref:hypothetical protein n=1 Tax=Persicobacter sp. CCB-QB2 TaxID=1561025 RepID=UPI0006A9D37F|nr:hypothetical protein [Persicobacter sp. CCB-QB2]
MGIQKIIAGFLFILLPGCNLIEKEKETKFNQENGTMKQCVVPKEVTSLIKKETIFLFAEIAIHEVDNIGNTVFSLDATGSFKRMYNKTNSLPTGVFEEDSDRSYSTLINSDKVGSFTNYLESLEKENISYYPTSPNIDVSGGQKLTSMLK